MYYDAIPIQWLPGDANRDNVVDVLDAQDLAENWLQTDATWAMGDFNDDDIVDDLDATIMAVNWGKVFVPPETAGAVPEPGALSLLLIIGMSFLWVRRR